MGSQRAPSSARLPRSDAALRSPDTADRRASATPASGSVADLLDLQRLAGNAALVAAMVPPSLAVQRHSSYEHQLLGDTRPSDVRAAHARGATTEEAWRHILEEELSRATAFKDDPRFTPTADFPQIRWLQLGTSRLWVSPGELSALGDYLPDPETIDTMPARTLVPVLQSMRQTIARSIYDRLGIGGDRLERNRDTRMTGAAGIDPETATFHNPLRDLSDDAATLGDLDKATAGLGPNRAKGLLARNACHFAPFSWERWSLYHNEARNLAAQAHGEPAPPVSLRMRDGQRMKEAERKAWVANGYSNHFLQDSFASGHLINKTLVMQWFVEYSKDLGWWDRPHFGMPDKAVLEAMATKRQPDIADRRAYRNPRLHTSASEDRARGRVVTDPQTTLEHADGEGRLAGSGVRSRDPEGAKEYGQYEAFLNNAYLSLAANDIHDHFNSEGLIVRNAAGYQFVVGGDGAMLRIQSEEAIGVALQADSLADQAIADILATGATTISVEDIFKLFPSEIVIDGKPVSLERWNDTDVKAYCIAHIVPEMAKKVDYKIVRAAGRDLVKGVRVLTPQER